MRKWLLFSLLIFAPALLADVPQTSAKIIFAGDLMGHVTQINAARKEAGGKGYDYKPALKHVKPYISRADIAVVNLEHPLGGEPYTGFPKFSSPDESIFAAVDAGFNAIGTANNHSLDRGKPGLMRTLSVLDSLKLPHFGMYRDLAEREKSYPAFIEKNGIKIAFINYTYGTNGLAIEEPNIVNMIDTAQIAADIAKAKQSSPDFIIAFMHWGTEYENVQNDEQMELARFIAMSGADLIVGSHPHVVQPFGKVFASAERDSVPVLFSLGNFFSNQRDRYTNGGIIFEVTLQKAEKTKAINFGYMPVWVYRFMQGGTNIFRLLPDCKRDASICKEYKMSADDKAAMDLFFEDTRKTFKNLQQRDIF